MEREEDITNIETLEASSCLVTESDGRTTFETPYCKEKQGISQNGRQWMDNIKDRTCLNCAKLLRTAEDHIIIWKERVSRDIVTSPKRPSYHGTDW